MTECERCPVLRAIQKRQPPAGSAVLLEAEGLGRRGLDGNRWLLRDVSLGIAAGEDVAVVGPTGAGKTLLPRSLALLDAPDAGRVLWRGEPVSAGDVPRFRSRVIYLHQRAALLPGSVEDNLRYPFTLQIHRARTFDRDWVIRVLAQTGRTAGFLGRSDRDLSGGERQIVALLRALQLEPEVLLLDEPTTALDSESAGTIETLVRQSRAGLAERATVWVSHNADQIQRVAQRVLLMEDGRLQEES